MKVSTAQHQLKSGSKGYHFLQKGCPKYTESHNFLESNIGGEGDKIFDDQNDGSHETEFYKILACLEG